MSNSSTIEFEPGAVDKLFAQMLRAANELNYDAGRAFRTGCKHLLNTLGTSTLVAPKMREYREITDKRLRSRKDDRTFLVRGWFGSPRKLQDKTVTVRSGVAGMKAQYATIKRRGLARATWRVAAEKAGLSGAIRQSVESSTNAIAAEKSSGSSRFEGSDMFLEVVNRLNYADAAMKGGASGIDGAMDRAASAMEHHIERALARRMGAT